MAKGDCKSIRRHNFLAWELTVYLRDKDLESTTINEATEQKDF